MVSRCKKSESFVGYIFAHSLLTFFAKEFEGKNEEREMPSVRETDDNETRDLYKA
jgi:hypothetical protein